MIKLVATLAIAAGIAQAASIHTETLTTVQTTVYDETTNTSLVDGPTLMKFSYNEQAVYPASATQLLSFSLSGFTFIDLRTYPDLSGTAGFDGLDVDGTASNGDSVVFGYAFADHAFSTPGIYMGVTHVPPTPPDSSVLVVDASSPEPSSLFLMAAGMAVLFVAKEAL